MFKIEVGGLLSRASEVSLFGIELKVGKEQAAKLEIAIQGYKDKINGFSEQVAMQQERIQELEGLREQLQQDIENCPEAKESSVMLNAQFTKILESNADLKQRSDILKDTWILQRMNQGDLKIKQ
ncbi:MAG: hypothetical protein KJO39_08085 [Bacteroidia bacterium]|nr:hypothetical protein [Bacteroidia bacterium]NNF29934.1 hypothetical protein [Flavobacteriaceae bacterium]NNJ82477.1 hypothetical protein [Flavobacteriaceae bacterium]NNK53639.1 hypothetical protein [Flavobacteriaceae bacterium]